MWTTIFTSVTSLFSNYLSTRRHNAELKQAIHKKQLEQVAQGNISASELDALSIQSRGWKDDFLLIITVTPLVLCFVPELSGHVRLGFQALNSSVPEWYMYALALVYIDTFGFRRILRNVLTNKLTMKK